jgi:hypothetical protein
MEGVMRKVKSPKVQMLMCRVRRMKNGRKKDVEHPQHALPDPKGNRSHGCPPSMR